MVIKPCNKICSKCAFNGSTKDTLYYELFDILKNGIIFPCHLYLKSKTGCEYLGAETLNEVRVCRGYVAFIKKYYLDKVENWRADNQYIWFQYLLNKIDDSELDEILSLEELIENHKGLRERIYLGNTITM